MYYIIYPFFYLLSLLPWRVLYWLSDGVYVLLYYVFGYRKKVVMNNLRIAFPDKTEQERVRIAKRFYRKFTDTFIETIKLLSVSEKSFAKRFSTNIGEVNDLFAQGYNIQILTGHFFNWEFANLGVAREAKFPFMVVYMPLGNKSFNKLIYDLRVRYGTILIPAVDFKAKFNELVQERYGLILVADQNPGSPDHAHWIQFFGRYTPFVKGPEKGAKRNNTAVVFAHFYAKRRGHYHVQFETLTTAPGSFEEGQLTILYKEHLERAIQKEPANYLWSHRRWKWTFDPARHVPVEKEQQ